MTDSVQASAGFKWILAAVCAPRLQSGSLLAVIAKIFCYIVARIRVGLFATSLHCRLLRLHCHPFAVSLTPLCGFIDTLLLAASLPPVLSFVVLIVRIYNDNQRHDAKGQLTGKWLTELSGYSFNPSSEIARWMVPWGFLNFSVLSGVAAKCSVTLGDFSKGCSPEWLVVRLRGQRLSGLACQTLNYKHVCPTLMSLHSVVPLLQELVICLRSDE